MRFRFAWAQEPPNAGKAAPRPCPNGAEMWEATNLAAGGDRRQGANRNARGLRLDDEKQSEPGDFSRADQRSCTFEPQAFSCLRSGSGGNGGWSTGTTRNPNTGGPMPPKPRGQCRIRQTRIIAAIASTIAVSIGPRCMASLPWRAGPPHELPTLALAAAGPRGWRAGAAGELARLVSWRGAVEQAARPKAGPWYRPGTKRNRSELAWTGLDLSARGGLR